MDRQQFGALTKENILWFLDRLRGLAHALRDIHNIIEEEKHPPSPNLTSPRKGLRKSAWHHDIKPQNILFFQIRGSKKGVFKIADFGSGKIHTLRSGSANTKSLNGTITYEPPEALYERVTSRPYDIWSLGCVFLELLLWAIFGFQSVRKFEEDRRGRSAPDSTMNIVDDAFWQMNAGKIVLRQAVVDRLRLLKEKVLEQESQPFKEVVELIPRMLDPDRARRIPALDLWDTLDRIYEQKRLDLSNIDDDSIPQSANPNWSTLPRLSLEAPDRPHLATTAPSPGEAMLNHTYLMSDSYLTVSPTDTLSPRSAGHRSLSLLGDNRPISPESSHSPRSASDSSMINHVGSRRSSNVSNSEFTMREGLE
jgi:serine/threonine protein kinase